MGVAINPVIVGSGFPAAWKETVEGLALEPIEKWAAVGMIDRYPKIEENLFSTAPTQNVTQQVALSPDGTYLATSIQTTGIFIYKKTDGKYSFLRKLQPDTSGYLCSGLRWSDDGLFLASANGGTISSCKVYQRSTGGDTFTARSIPLLSTNANACAFSPGAKYLAVAWNSSPCLSIYKRSGSTFTKLANPYVMPPGGCMSCSFSSDGTLLAVGTMMSPYIVIYRIEEDVFTKEADIYPEVITQEVVDCNFTPDSTGLIADGKLFVRSGNSFDSITFTSSPLASSGNGFSQDGEYLYMYHKDLPDCYIYRKAGNTFSLIHTFDITTSRRRTDMNVSADGGHIAFGEVQSGALPMVFQVSYSDVPYFKNLTPESIAEFAGGAIAGVGAATTEATEAEQTIKVNMLKPINDVWGS